MDDDRSNRFPADATQIVLKAPRFSLTRGARVSFGRLIRCDEARSSGLRRGHCSELLSMNNATMMRARAAVVTAMADLSISAASRSTKKSMVRTVNTMSVYIGVVRVC